MADKLVDNSMPTPVETRRQKEADMDALVADKVRKTFEAENAPARGLRGASLVVPSGDFVALMGPSGCGKSTLLNVVAGLDVADEGTIIVAGEEVTGRSEDDLARNSRRHIGIVFQFFNLLEGMTVLENVALPAVIAGHQTTERREPGPGPPGSARHRRQGVGRCPGCFRAVNANAWLSPGRWPTSRRCCSPMSQPGRSTLRAVRRSWSCSLVCTLGVRPLCWSLMTVMSLGKAQRVLRMRDGRLVADHPAIPGDQPVGGGPSLEVR